MYLCVTDVFFKLFLLSPVVSLYALVLLRVSVITILKELLYAHVSVHVCVCVCVCVCV